MSTTSIQTIALSGASGTFGSALLKALLDANFTVTALTRLESNATFSPDVKVAKVNYEDTSSLRTALEGQDALISTVGYSGILSQIPLFSAAIAAGVKRILPSEYGSDRRSSNAAALPVFGHKVQVFEHLKQAIQGTSTTYTLVANNEFFDWGLDHSFGVDIAARRIEIVDGGDVPCTASPLSFVARGVVSVVQNPEKTANTVVRLHGASMTQNRLLALVQRFSGTTDADWTITHSRVEEREGEAYAALQKAPEDFMTWALMMLQCAVWGTKFDNDFAESNDNEMLGLNKLSEGDIEEIVRARC